MLQFNSVTVNINFIWLFGPEAKFRHLLANGIGQRWALVLTWILVVFAIARFALSRYTLPMIVYLNGRFLSKEEARISPDDRGFLFADGVYEVVRVYPKGMFEAKAHWERLERSLRELAIKLPKRVNWNDISEELLRDNNLKGKDAVIYLQITRGEAPRKHAFPVPAAVPTIYGFAVPFTPPVEQWKKGIKAVLAPDIRWTRCDIKTVSLLPNCLANQRAHEQGADEAVLVRDGVITEGSHSNFAAIVDGTFVTHPFSNLILGGITRSVVLRLCHKLKIPVREFPILESEVLNAQEMMMLGTTTEVLPVVQLGEHKISNGKPGPITRKLQEAFWKLTK